MTRCHFYSHIWKRVSRLEDIINPEWEKTLWLAAAQRCVLNQRRPIGRLSVCWHNVCMCCLQRPRVQQVCQCVNVRAPSLCVAVCACTLLQSACFSSTIAGLHGNHPSKQGWRTKLPCMSLSVSGCHLTLVFFLIECDLWDIGLRATLSLNQRSQQWGSKINHESTGATRRGYDRSLIKDWTLSTLAQIFLKLYIFFFYYMLMLQLFLPGEIY